MLDRTSKNYFFDMGFVLDDVAAPALFGIGRSLQLEGSQHAGIDNQLNIFLDNQLKGRRMDLLATTTSTCNQFFLAAQSRAGQTGTRRAADHDNRTNF